MNIYIYIHCTILFKTNILEKKISSPLDMLHYKYEFSICRLCKKQNWYDRYLHNVPARIIKEFQRILLFIFTFLNFFLALMN